MIHKVIISLILFIGILFIAIQVTNIKAGLTNKEPKVIYRYIPRTFEEEQEDPLLVSDVFETMFSQPSPWLQSIRTYDIRKQEAINKYFITQL